MTKGHFATSHSHTNYYIDVTTQKMRLSEAKAVALKLMTIASTIKSVMILFIAFFSFLPIFYPTTLIVMGISVLTIDFSPLIGS